MTKDIISPVSIDLGAKYTGVYFAHYEACSSIEDIEKDGKVYQLEKDSYTLLMVNRTAKRHQRRGYDRRQMVKRLFKLIWEKRFRLGWDKDVQQTTSFLFNRRGFSFLTEEYDAEILSWFPREAYHLLPDELKIAPNDKGKYDFASALTEWGNEGEEKTKSMFDAIDKEPKRIRNRLFFIGKTKKLKEYCDIRQGENIIPDEEKKNLENLSKWVWDEWQDSGVHGLDETFVAKDQNNGSEIDWKTPASFNLVTYLNQQGPEVAGRILYSLPNTSLEEKELKDSIWHFKAENFSLEDKDFTPPEPPDENATRTEQEDYEKAVSGWKQLHLQHLAFALHKTLNELQSGGRHRSKYFKEIKEVLENKRSKGTKKDGKPIGDDYIDRFCKKLNEEYQDLTVDDLTRLISHLSNLELKPLRKYFNDKKHKNGDYWDNARLNEIFEHWILREWRINPEKDKDKVEGKQGDYKKLCKDWKAHKDHNGSVVDFWLKTDPFSTIPPYQDNNNRRPPRCQSLILNPVYLDNRYPEWQSWLTELKDAESVQEYLADYEKELHGPKSGKDKSYFSDETTACVKKDHNGVERKKTEGEIRAGNSQRRNLKALDARILQFIFDRVKADDPLNLNEIYSHAKKYRQQQSRKEAKDKLEKAIECSELPDTLKTIRDYQNSAVFEQGTFLHLTCKYYKLRQRARDGRIFIHPEYRYVKDRGYENTGRFDDDNCLLTYCNHKPRQKRYQMLGDLARILCTTEANLKNKANITEDVLNDRKNPKRLFEKIENFFKEIKVGQHGLKGFMEDCAKAQKDYGNALNESIEHNYKELEKIVRQEEEEQLNKPLSKIKLKENAKSRLITETAAKRETSTREEIKTDINRLIRLKEKSHGFAGPLAERIHENLAEDEKKAIIDKFDDPFSLAQIYNIVYKERNGYSRTCFVCSKDNSLRIFNENQQVYGAKASRLPAIPTRVIDGAVMRMARITASAIIKDKWPKIEEELKVDHKVHIHIPIIIEANRFEFEPSKEELVKSQRVTSRKGKALARRSDYSDKDDRIKKDGGGLCPYTGEELSNAGEVDHIIPRRSEWGTLNDEANLIWASHIGNHHKRNIHLSLGNLKINYKDAQFPGKDDAGIEQWIIEQIGNGEGENFKFGPYRSFINLTPEQQKAFRHALFLSASHPLRNKVIEAINNRNRALVNGTQRYFAEVLANGLYKKAAKNKCKQNLLSFDYFEASTDPGSSNVNVRSVRKHFEDKQDGTGEYIHSELQEHRKGKETQSSYSHLIDATTAFMIALSEHYKDGSLKINVPYISPYDYSYSDDNGELKDLYTALKIDCADFKSLGTEPLQRQIPGPQESRVTHRPLFNENAVAMHFLKLIEIKEPNQETTYLRGFLNLSELKKCLHENRLEDNDCYKKYAAKLSDNDSDKYLPLYKDKFAVGSGTGTPILTGFGEKRVTVNIYSLDKKKVFRFLIEHFNTASDVSLWGDEMGDELKTLKLLYGLWYFTQRQKIIVKDGNRETPYKLKDNNKKCGGFVDPQIEKNWADLHSSIDGSQDLRTQLKDHFLNKADNGQRVPKHTHEHKKTTKEFSLPISCQKGLLIRKKNWKGEDVYYCRPVSNDFSQTLLHKDQLGVIPDTNKDERLVSAYRQKNIFYSSDSLNKLKKELRPVDAELAIDPNKYYEAQIPQEFSDYICRVENQRTDAERPRFRFHLNPENRMDFTTFKRFVRTYPFRNLQDLSSGLKKEWVEKILDTDSLDNSIEKVDGMDKKPKKLLPTLKEIKTLFEESQTNQILAYSAKGKFTLTAPSVSEIPRS